MSSANEYPKNEDIQKYLTTLLGRKALAIDRIGGGKNSQVYHLTCENNASTVEFAVKRYYQHQSDQRDRLGVEFSALKFLWDHGVRCIPQPVISSPGDGFAVYEYIDGIKKSADEITNKDIDNAVFFLTDLRKLSDESESLNFKPASEACFSIDDVIDNVRKRFHKLVCVKESGLVYDDLHLFLEHEFLNAFTEIALWCERHAKDYGISVIDDIPQEQKTLSPSDFGFHNALWRNGEIVFLDFEYFGWDDPAKMIVDFILHPAFPMQIQAEQKTRFTSTIIDHFSQHLNLKQRVEIVYPLFGLKWIMIILNEFLPADLKRRQFAQQNLIDKEKIQMEQLEKARQWLEIIIQEYEKFPYC